jgi:dCMP deaminase
MPHEYQPYIMGDPRANLEAGEHTEISTSCHSEMSVVAKAARSGIRIDGSSIIVTTFPCPTCAMLIAEAGIKQVFFIDGYSSVNSLDIFKKYEIEIFQIIE